MKPSARPVQYFDQAYLEQCRTATPKQVLEFLESYRLMQAGEDTSRLISIKIPENLLAAFRQRCDVEGVKYQTQIKTLMRHWLMG